MLEERTVGGGRLWAEVIGIALFFIGAQIFVAVAGGIGYALYLGDPELAQTQLTDPLFAAKLAFLTLPIGTIITLVATYFVLKSRGVNWCDLGLRKPKNIPMTLLVGLGIFLVVAILAPLVNMAMEALGETQDLTAFDFLQGDFFMYIYLITIISWFSAAFGEEFIFRGLIMGNIAKSLGDTQKAWIIAAVVQAAIFGAFHLYQGLNGFVSTGFVALIFGFFYFKLRSLWPVIIAHGVLDVFGISMLYYNVDIPV